MNSGFVSVGFCVGELNRKQAAKRALKCTGHWATVYAFNVKQFLQRSGAEHESMTSTLVRESVGGGFHSPDLWRRSSPPLHCAYVHCIQQGSFHAWHWCEREIRRLQATWPTFLKEAFNAVLNSTLCSRWSPGLVTRPDLNRAAQ